MERVQVFPVEQTELWAAVTEASLLSTWFGAVPDRDLVAGAHVRFTWPDGSSRDAAVEIADAPNVVVLGGTPWAMAGR